MTNRPTIDDFGAALDRMIDEASTVLSEKANAKYAEQARGGGHNGSRQFFPLMDMLEADWVELGRAAISTARRYEREKVRRSDLVSVLNDRMVIARGRMHTASRIRNRSGNPDWASLVKDRIEALGPTMDHMVSQYAMNVDDAPYEEEKPGRLARVGAWMTNHFVALIIGVLGGAGGTVLGARLLEMFRSTSP